MVSLFSLILSDSFFASWFVIYYSSNELLCQVSLQHEDLPLRFLYKNTSGVTMKLGHGTEI